MMNDFSLGFKGYEKAEDIHGQIALCKEAGKSFLHLKNMNFNFACNYSENQAKEIKKILDREGVKALSLWVGEKADALNALRIAAIYGTEYLVAETEEIKNELLKKSNGSFTVINEKEE